MTKLEFDAIITSPDDVPKAAFITAPFDIKELFGTKGRIDVKGTIDGEPFRGTFQPMGGCHIMGAVDRNAQDTISTDLFTHVWHAGI